MSKTPFHEIYCLPYCCFPGWRDPATDLLLFYVLFDSVIVSIHHRNQDRKKESMNQETQKYKSRCQEVHAPLFETVDFGKKIIVCENKSKKL